MNISDRGIALLVKFEGEILEVYLDPIGLPTLGVGHLLTKRERTLYPVGTKISKEVSRAFLHTDLERFEDAVNRLVEVKLTQNQYDALVCLAFNIGIGAFTKSTLLKKLNRNDIPGAADAFNSWVRAGGRVLPGLVTRRKAERKLFLTPDTKPAVSASPSPALGGGETQTKPSNPPPPPSAESSFTFENALGWADKASDAESRVDKGTWIKVLASRLFKLLLVVSSFAFENWQVTVGVLAVIAAVSVFFYLRRRRPKK